ncbi:MAG: hypothetical protein GEU95_10520 [Rhizobiales bacterium]|nr:hypothetical protein [Hyphomicrobiales bacterium]
MLLIILYLAFVAVFGATSVLIGFAVESMWGTGVSLIVFLLFNAFALWISWVLAVKLSALKLPKAP